VQFAPAGNGQDSGSEQAQAAGSVSELGSSSSREWGASLVVGEDVPMHSGYVRLRRVSKQMYLPIGNVCGVLSNESVAAPPVPGQKLHVRRQLRPGTPEIVLGRGTSSRCLSGLAASLGPDVGRFQQVSDELTVVPGRREKARDVLQGVSGRGKDDV
jgi:hypothetical protein